MPVMTTTIRCLPCRPMSISKTSIICASEEAQTCHSVQSLHKLTAPTDAPLPGGPCTIVPQSSRCIVLHSCRCDDLCHMHAGGIACRPPTLHPSPPPPTHHALRPASRISPHPGPFSILAQATEKLALSTSFSEIPSDPFLALYTGGVATADYSASQPAPGLGRRAGKMAATPAPQQHPCD